MHKEVGVKCGKGSEKKEKADPSEEGQEERGRLMFLM